MLDSDRDRKTLADLTVTIYGVGPVTVIELSGEFDPYTAYDLRRHLDYYASSRLIRVVVDLRALTFIDSAGIAVLVALGKRAAAQSGTLRLVLPENHLLVKLQRMGLVKLWPIHPDPESAISAAARDDDEAAAVDGPRALPVRPAPPGRVGPDASRRARGRRPAESSGG